MSKNYPSKEEAINQLYATIKAKFEQDGVLQEVRCLLQTKMVNMMRGKSETSNNAMKLLVPRHGCDDDMQPDASLQLLHQLIMEYFHWHGFHYAAEMFAMESATENVPPVRERLEGVLATKFEHDNMPILLELVANLMDKRK